MFLTLFLFARACSANQAFGSLFSLYFLHKIRLVVTRDSGTHSTGGSGCGFDFVADHRHHQALDHMVASDFHHRYHHHHRVEHLVRKVVNIE